jgi:protein-S-isoprenylcysteine O-methyltransferase Ste14
MWQEIFNWTWLALFIVIIFVRKMHEYNARRRTSLQGTPFAEAALMALWGLAASVGPFFYIFGSWLDFADLPLEPSPLFGISGVALFLVAIWLLHRSHNDLGELWSPTVEAETAQPLVVEGVYKRIRHPMYAAHVLWGIAQTLLLPNLVAGPLALILVLFMLALRIPREERAMIEEFGEDYYRYMDSTGRIVPKLSM